MIWPVWGMVKNGVVVAHNPLPEGSFVLLIPPPAEPIEFTEEERAEFEAWSQASPRAFEHILRLEQEDGQGDSKGR
jgi:hypothetical protein